MKITFEYEYGPGDTREIVLEDVVEVEKRLNKADHWWEWRITLADGEVKTYRHACINNRWKILEDNR